MSKNKTHKLKQCCHLAGTPHITGGGGRKAGGKIYKAGGKVRGAGCATKGTRAAKMVTMKGS